MELALITSTHLKKYRLHEVQVAGKKFLAFSCLCQMAIWNTFLKIYLSVSLWPLKSLGVVRGVGLLKANNHFCINVAQKNSSLVNVQNNILLRLIATSMMVKSIFFFFCNVHWKVTTHISHASLNDLKKTITDFRLNWFQHLSKSQTADLALLKISI